MQTPAPLRPAPITRRARPAATRSSAPVHRSSADLSANTGASLLYSYLYICISVLARREEIKKTETWKQTAEAYPAVFCYYVICFLLLFVSVLTYCLFFC